MINKFNIIIYIFKFNHFCILIIFFKFIIDNRNNYCFNFSNFVNYLKKSVNYGRNKSV